MKRKTQNTGWCSATCWFYARPSPDRLIGFTSDRGRFRKMRRTTEAGEPPKNESGLSVSEQPARCWLGYWIRVRYPGQDQPGAKPELASGLLLLPRFSSRFCPAWPIVGKDWLLNMTSGVMQEPGSLLARSRFASIVKAAPFQVAPRGEGEFEEGPRGQQRSASRSPGEDITPCRFSWFRPSHFGHPSSFFGFERFRLYLVRCASGSCVAREEEVRGCGVFRRELLVGG